MIGITPAAFTFKGYTVEHHHIVCSNNSFGKLNRDTTGALNQQNR
jgi:hypothetical protein